MPIQSSQFGSLSESAQLQKLKGAKVALWIVGILTLVVQTFLFMNVEKEYDDSLAEEASKRGISVSVLRENPAAWAEVEKEKEELTGKGRTIYGIGIGLGVVFVLCALMVNKKPVAATLTGLVLYVGGIIAFGVIDPSSVKSGIIIKFIIIGVLATAVKAAFAYEKEQRQRVA